MRLGQTLKLQTVAEGVEAPLQLAELQSLGCDLGQGYYLGYPVAGATLETTLRETVAAGRT